MLGTVANRRANLPNLLGGHRSDVEEGGAVSQVFTAAGVGRIGMIDLIADAKEDTGAGYFALFRIWIAAIIIHRGRDIFIERDVKVVLHFSSALIIHDDIAMTLAWL